ncbi:MAG: hypothetical protein RIE58_12120 [Vicingaceae bacterium]
MIISLHSPKAGGDSFKEILRNHFGKGLKEDYGDIPLNKTPVDAFAAADSSRKAINLMSYLYPLKGITCIHGHFVVWKYSGLIGRNNVHFVTWLRDPAERVISHYHYWKRTYNPLASAPLHKRIVDEDWSLEKFCFSEEMRDVYSRLLWKVPIETFDFVGITEHYEEDASFFAHRFLNTELTSIPYRNAGPMSSNGPQDESMIKRLKEFHAADYKIYEAALNLRKSRASLGADNFKTRTLNNN